MNYVGDIIRPPSEADAVIIQVTVGCSHNRCTFCGAYKDKNKQFRIRSEEEILENLAFADKYCRRQKRVFLADGDALILSQKRLLHIFSLIRSHLPQVRRIALYGNAKAIRSKTVGQLQELKQKGLHRIYMGFESGDDEVLRAVKKGETAKSMIEAAEKVNQAGIFLSVSVLLGLAGSAGSLQHAAKSGEVLSQMNPKQIAALCLMPLANTAIGKGVSQGTFVLPDSRGILLELRQLLQHISCRKVQFMANHASNYLPISGRLSRDKTSILHMITQALQGNQPLVPEKYRAL